MKFWKMNGAGNDFIIINNIEEKIPTEEFPRMAKLLCERHLSIGADGLMAVEKPTENVTADYRMLFYNSDGSVGEMCGNGARCICRYDEPIAVDGRLYSCSYAELGSPGIPHCVVAIKNLRDYPESELLELARRLRNYKGYPKGANVNFCEIIGPDLVFERTYERGVEDFTYACGTGTSSVVAILTLQGRVSGRNVKVDVPGGTLVIDVEMKGDKIENLYLTGPTNIVAKGEIADEDL